MDYTITFACYNQVDYTKQCIDSLIKTDIDLGRVVAVDNGSSDETIDYLHSLPLGDVILNKSNLGCGVAWDQGALKFQSEWTIVMNNDIVTTHNWLEGLLHTAESQGLQIVCPAMIEGDLNYDLTGFAASARLNMKHTLRRNLQHAVCMAIHKDVWKTIGYFRPEPQLLGYEDTLFFQAASQKHIARAISGASWIHHFGSITQKAMKTERGLAEEDDLGYRWNSRLLNESWFKRKLNKLSKLRLIAQYKQAELEKFGRTLHGWRRNNEFEWL